MARKAKTGQRRLIIPQMLHLQRRFVNLLCAFNDYNISAIRKLNAPTPPLKRITMRRSAKS